MKANGIKFDSDEIYAHTPSVGGWHKLCDHLLTVAMLAQKLGESFGKGNQAFWIGLMHDIGKVNPSFQEYIRKIAKGGSGKAEPHAIWGAAFLYSLLASLLVNNNSDTGWENFCLPIMGHHTGLPDKGTGELQIKRFRDTNMDTLLVMKEYLEKISAKVRAITREGPKLEAESDLLARELEIRMLFSALVDADYLDTESHFNRDTHYLRKAWPEIGSLYRVFAKRYQDYVNRLKDSSCDEIVKIREYVYSQCLEKSEEKPGIFTLTAPTGSGKTLGYLAFSLNHAVKYNKSRIIIVLPYTSIIEQTAKIISSIIGNDAVLEHHSAFDILTVDEEARVNKYMLAIENWDAPVIITTTVQFFESLLSNKPSKTRKIHNIANSVVVLDEVQALPPEMLKPTLDIVRTLATKYCVSFVLSTATQPTFEIIDGNNAYSALNCNEIVSDYNLIFEKMRRVRYEIIDGTLTWAKLAAAVQSLQQVLVIFNTRKHALKLFNMLAGECDAYHLSAMLCPKHRSNILEEVKQRLENGLSVRLITTQVVEAGVDLDFSEVWRVIGPLDRIVQAAGRCNRNGNLDQGRVVIFEPEEEGSPGGPYKVGIEKSRLILSRYSPEDLHYPYIFRQYFRSLYNSVNLDVQNVQIYRKALNYPEVANRYKLIREKTAMVVIPYGEGSERLREFEAFPTRETWRSLQPFVVNVSEKEIIKYIAKGYAREIKGNIFEWMGPYDEHRGLTDLYADPSDLII